MFPLLAAWYGGAGELGVSSRTMRLIPVRMSDFSVSDPLPFVSFVVSSYLQLVRISILYFILRLFCACLR